MTFPSRLYLFLVYIDPAHFPSFIFSRAFQTPIGHIHWTNLFKVLQVFGATIVTLGTLIGVVLYGANATIHSLLLKNRFPLSSFRSHTLYKSNIFTISKQLSTNMTDSGT